MTEEIPTWETMTDPDAIKWAKSVNLRKGSRNIRCKTCLLHRGEYCGPATWKLGRGFVTGLDELCELWVSAQ